MNLMVPIFTCRVLFSRDITEYKAGQSVEMPYGMALLIASQDAGVIADEKEVSVRAMEHLLTYGADGWFPRPLQTAHHISTWLAEQASAAVPRSMN